MIQLYLENKEYLDRVREYEEESFIPEYLDDRLEDHLDFLQEVREEESYKWHM